MNKLLLMYFCFFTSVSSAQWSCDGIVTFDSGDTLMPVAVSIDTMNYHHNIWQIGSPHKTVFTSAYSLPNTIVTDTVNPYPVNDTSLILVKMPTNLTHVGQFLFEFQFSYQLDIDTGTVAKIEVSGDAGLHWSNVLDSLPFGFSWAGSIPNLSTSTTGWSSFDLMGCGFCPGASDTILFRFTFISDSISTTKDGWMMDNMEIYYWCEANVGPLQDHDSIIISPNPTSLQFAINSSQLIHQVTITDLLGQIKFAQKYNSDRIIITVQNLPPGTYFAKINNSITKMFVKE